MIDHDAVRDWAWWSSPEWTAYCREYGSEPGRPVKGPSYVVDLTQPIKLRRDTRSRSKAYQAVEVVKDVEQYHAAHRAAAGRETRSQATWNLMQTWVDREKAQVLRSRDAWRLVMLDHPGAYDASAAGPDAHWLVHWILLELQAQGYKWYELGDAATPGLETFKSGFGEELVAPSRTMSTSASTVPD